MSATADTAPAVDLLYRLYREFTAEAERLEGGSSFDHAEFQAQECWDALRALGAV